MIGIGIMAAEAKKNTGITVTGIAAGVDAALADRRRKQ